MRCIIILMIVSDLNMTLALIYMVGLAINLIHTL